MLDMVVVSKSESLYQSGILNSDPAFSSLQKNIDHYLEQKKQQVWTREEVKEYLLFMEQNHIIGYSFVEGETDMKKARASYQLLGTSASLEQTSQIIEKTTTYAFQEMGMLDVYWQAEKDPSAFLLTRKSGFDCWLDKDMVIYSQESLEMNQIKK